MCLLSDLWNKVGTSRIDVTKVPEQFVLYEHILDIFFHVINCEIFDSQLPVTLVEGTDKSSPRSTGYTKLNVLRDNQFLQTMNDLGLVPVILIQTINEEAESRRQRLLIRNLFQNTRKLGRVPRLQNLVVRTDLLD
jgi:hypothetical protein